MVKLDLKRFFVVAAIQGGNGRHDSARDLCRPGLIRLRTRPPYAPGVSALKPLGLIGRSDPADGHYIGRDPQIFDILTTMPDLAHRVVGGAHGVIKA